MKKYRNKRKEKLNIPALIIISVILLFIFGFLYFLQANIFPLITINGIAPNLFVMFVLMIGLFGNNFLAILFGIIIRNVFRSYIWGCCWNNSGNALFNWFCSNMV